jgi:hypothetical protein
MGRVDRAYTNVESAVHVHVVDTPVYTGAPLVGVDAFTVRLCLRCHSFQGGLEMAWPQNQSNSLLVNMFNLVTMHLEPQATSGLQYRWCNLTKHTRPFQFASQGSFVVILRQPRSCPWPVHPHPPHRRWTALWQGGSALPPLSTISTA